MKQQKPHRKRRYVLWGILLLFLVKLLFGACHAIFVEPDQLNLVERTISLPDLPEAFDGYRIAVLSDLHLTKKPKDLSLFRRAVALANAQSPDAVFLLGDFVDGNIPGNSKQIETAGEELGKLRSRDGLFAVMGNHERKLGTAKVAACLERNGIVVLENDSRPILRNGDTMYVAGLAERNPDYRLSSLREADSRDPVLLLSHYPDRALLVEPPVALSFAGHTHGGQVVLPLVGALIVYSKYRLLHGLEERNGRRIFITSGIGTSMLRIRSNAPPEVVLITLRKQ